MKLKNKKTGEIADVEIQSNCMLVTHQDGRIEQYYFDSIKDLLEWEDYEEPKDFWYIDDFMIVCGTEGEFTTPDLASFTKKDIEKLKEIGNYFESKEEAEKAVEKLKAWKRLKDKGFRFEYYDYSDRDLHNHIQIKAITNREVEDSMLYKEDLDLLFGGEE